MDLFIVCEQDKKGVIKKMKELGIVSIYENNVKASGTTWYEEEGIYIKFAELVLVLVDKEMLEDTCDGYCINTAISQKKKIWVYFQDDDADLIEGFNKKWNIDNHFFDANKLLNSLIEYQIANNTLSGLSIKFDMYFKSFMLDEALSVCDEFQKRYNEQINQAYDNYIKVILTDELSKILERKAQIYFVKGQFLSVEQIFLEELSIVKKYEVIWAKNKEIFIKNLLKRLYLYFLKDKNKENQIDEFLALKSIIGIDEKNAEASKQLMLQQVSLYYEKCILLKKQYDNQSTNEPITLDNHIHYLIGEHIQSSILLFNELAKQGVDLGFKECLRTSYERLTEYCKIIGAKELAIKCLDLIASNINNINSIDFNETNESKINLKCIKAYLGETQPDSGFYDVFISHKSNDTDMALDIYSFLKNKGKEPFLDRVILPILGDSEYRNSILDAIDKSAHFILVASDIEFLKSNWVSQEYNIFCDEKREGRKNGNLIMVFPNEVCQEIFKNNKRNLPIQLRSFEIISYESFADNLVKYIL